MSRNSFPDVLRGVGLGLLLPWLGLASLPFEVHADSNIGDIRAIETDATILQPGEPFDLNGRTVTFSPKAEGGYTVSVGSLNFDPRLGANLGMGDDTSAFQPLSFTFPFFGVNRSGVFVNSNGHITFEGVSALPHFNAGGSVSSLGSDISSVLDLFAGSQPRIAVLWQDWDPSAAGAVFANSLADRFIVTWNGLPLFRTGTTATFQAILFVNGAIQFSYQNVITTPGGGYLVGVSPGRFSRFLVTTVDFSEGSASSISAFPNFEPLAQVFGTTAAPLVHVPAVARRFFGSHPDRFDQLVMFANFRHAMGDAFAFELTAQQTVTGIGLGQRSISSYFGSSGRFQSFLNMNRLDVYPADPTTTLLGTNSTLDIMAQESGHQWLAFVRFDDRGVCSDQLLGRDLAHWSFFHDTDASDMEGNKWQDNGNGTFTTIEATERYSALDQYIMGLRPSTDVPNFFFVRNPSSASCAILDPATGERSCAPRVGVTVSGIRQDVSLSQIITCAGARSPSSGFSAINPSTTWNQAFILLVPAGSAPSQADVDRIDRIRAAWEPYFNRATDGRGAADTTLFRGTIAPGSIDLATSPASFTITGGGFANTGFGLPVVNFTRGGTLIGQARATAMSGGTTLTVPFPDNATSLVGPLPGLSAGAVSITVYNQSGPSSYNLLGSIELTVTDTRPAPGVSSISPSSIDLATPPASFTVAGGGFNNMGFGLPVVNFTRGGTLIGQARATALSSSTTLTVPFPTNATSLVGPLPGGSAGAVSVIGYNQSGPNSYSQVGSIDLAVTDTRPCTLCVTGVTPNAIDLATPPASFTVAGGGFNNMGFGLPVVNFTRGGTLIGQARATALSSGTTLTVPFPDNATSLVGPLPGLSAGAVSVIVYNQSGPNSYSQVGSVSLTVVDTRPCTLCVTGVTPNAIDLATPPASFTVAGAGFANTGFGLPVVNFTRGGTLIGQARATAMSGGTTLTVPFPDNATSLVGPLPGLSAGAVSITV